MTPYSPEKQACAVLLDGMSFFELLDPGSTISTFCLWVLASGFTQPSWGSIRELGQLCRQDLFGVGDDTHVTSGICHLFFPFPNISLVDVFY